MDNNDKQDFYDTTIYSDFSDLPTVQQNELWKEWLTKTDGEKKQQQTYTFLPIAMGAIAFIFVLVSLIIFIVAGMTPLVIVFLACAIIPVIALLILSPRLSRIRTAQLRRFASWLKTEKHILASLKQDIEKENKSNK